MSESSVTELEEMSIGERVKEAMASIDLPGALREVFGKCPTCGTPLVMGNWLKWCPVRTCDWRAPK